MDPGRCGECASQVGRRSWPTPWYLLLGTRRVSSTWTVLADAVVLAAWHSARELYVELVARGAALAPKDFAVGFRVEHPRAVINSAQYGAMARYCEDGGRGVLPSASYRLATTVSPADVAADAAARAVVTGEGAIATDAAADRYTALGRSDEGGRRRQAPGGR